MSAHQIVYTSCRRGIEDGGEGLQVYSYDKDLPKTGLDLGRGYGNLFVVPEPSQVGASAFGCRPFADDYLLFSHSTELEHDYLSGDARGGNVLRHAILAQLGDVSFRPIELYGSGLLMTDIGPEVALDVRPDYLPSPALSPSGAVSLQGVAAWLLEGEGRRIEGLRSLMAALGGAGTSGSAQTVAVVDTPENVVMWIAAVEYALPVRLARQVSFVNNCSRPASVGVDIVGCTLDEIEDIPSYLVGNVKVFDPAGAPAPVPADVYLDFVSQAYRNDPTALESLCAWIGENTDADFDLTQLGMAYRLWQVVCQVMSVEVFDLLSLVEYCREHAGGDVQDKLACVVAFSLDGTVPPIGFLGFLFEHARALSTDAMKCLEGVLAKEVAALLADSSMGNDEFDFLYRTLERDAARRGIDLDSLVVVSPDVLGTLTGACACDAGKVATLCSLVLAPAPEVMPHPDAEFLKSAVAGASKQGAAAVALVADAAMGVRPDSLVSLEDVAVQVEAVCGRDTHAVDGVWAAAAARFEVRGAEDAAALVELLCSHARFSLASKIASEAFSSMSSARESARLFSFLSGGDFFRFSDYACEVYPAVVQGFVADEATRTEPEAADALITFVKSVVAQLEGGVGVYPCCRQAVAVAAQHVTRGIAVGGATGRQLFLLDRLLAFEELTGEEVLPRHAALAAALLLLEGQLGERDSRAVLARLSDRLDVSQMSGHERVGFLLRLSRVLARPRSTYRDYDMVFQFFGLSTKDKDELVRKCVDVAVPLAKGSRRNVLPLLVILDFATVPQGGEGMRRIVEKCVRKMDDQSLDALRRAVDVYADGAGDGRLTRGRLLGVIDGKPEKESLWSRLISANPFARR